ncbi:anti-sigma factor family protein [Leptolyngbya sp. 7M]|uniref:anti-sigma factor family protein n=1 Tax=Leptolyngbya sp. 7M TaxID=2812896 RepID=UPI001B8AA150|nr:zf-HC2 domain-containing protein [Leptolyngbya sp. 7M]QYO64369.1 zf-HC2 domain-containing protein [Leptolyngbya sp. 7M]
MINHLDEFDERNNPKESINTEQSNECLIAESSAEAHPELSSIMQRDRFELLSAYLDGEVSANERRQVEQWLATDAKTQQLYTRLLTLRQRLHTLPIAQSEQSVDQLVDRVTARIECQPKRLIWGGLAAAAVLIGALFSALPQNSYAPSIADSLTPNEDVPSDGLMIAINHPPIEIPKAAVAPGVLQDSPQTIR